MSQFDGGLSEIPRCLIYSCENLSTLQSLRSSFYMFHVDLSSWNLHPRSMFSAAPELPSFIPIICSLFISGPPNTRIMQECRTFTDPTMLHNLQSNAQDNRCQFLDSPETDPAHYNSNHPGIDRLPKRYQVDVLYPKSRLADSRLTRRMQPSISLLRHGGQAHLTSTLLSRVIVSDLTLHAYSIHHPIFECRHWLLTCDITPHMPPLNDSFCSIPSIFPSFLNALNLWLPATTECHVSDTEL